MLMVPWNGDLLCEPHLNAMSFVPEDIWKKFDLDPMLDHDFTDFSLSSSHDNSSSKMLQTTSDLLKNCQDQPEIRHHDCMWAGTCISKEHRHEHALRLRQLSCGTQSVYRRIPPGRSVLLRNKNSQQQQQQQTDSHSRLQQQQHLQRHATTTTTMATTATTLPTTPYHQAGNGWQSANACGNNNRGSNSVESSRPDTPQSLSTETDTEDDEIPIFRHEQISLQDIVSMPVSEVTGQQVQRRTHFQDKWHSELQQHQQRVAQEALIRSTTLEDHCYHLNQDSIKKHERLNVPPTPSDTEEEIDVVSCDKPRYPAKSAASATLSLPNQPSLAEQQHFQHTVNSALKQQRSPRKSTANSAASTPSTTRSYSGRVTPEATTPPPVPRGRGRPPANGSASRKRAAQPSSPSSSGSEKKSARHSITNSSAGRRSHGSRTSSLEDDMSMEKRHQHNNMERKRRVHLRYMFDDLRKQVPELASTSNKFAPKVKILNGAATLVRKLVRTEQSNLLRLEEQRQRKRRLEAHLRSLKIELNLL